MRPKIMIKLPGAVVIAGSGGEQPEAVRQRTQPAARVKIMILVIDFDPVQPVITDEGHRARSAEARARGLPHRMGDHCKAARLVYQVDAAIHLDRVAVNMRGPPSARKRSNASCRSRTWPASISASAMCGRPTDGLSPTWAITSASLTGTPAPPASPGHRLAGPAGRRVLEPSPRPGQDSPDRRRTPGCARCCRAGRTVPSTRTTWTPSRSPSPDCAAIQTVEGVVISQADDVQPDCTSLTHRLSWRVRTVGDRGSSVEVDPHTSDLSRCTEPH